ncbi:hypothetical protein EGR52_00655 [bacterium]|nr:hypothetical protein [bacterium]
MKIYIFTNNIIKLESEYFSIGKYKKLGNNLINVYKITNIILTIITIIILYKVLNLDNYINISILYLISLLPFIIFNLLFYFIIFKNNKCSKKREENKINYIKVIKKSIITNKIKVLYSIITSSYFYTSIIMLYFLLINKYNYTYDVVGTYITNTYLYGLIIIYFIYLFIKNNYIDKFILNKNNFFAFGKEFNEDNTNNWFAKYTILNEYKITINNKSANSTTSKSYVQGEQINLKELLGNYNEISITDEAGNKINFEDGILVMPGCNIIITITTEITQNPHTGNIISIIVAIVGVIGAIGILGYTKNRNKFIK